LNGGPAAITVGSGDELWFGELFGNRIGRITTDGAIEEFELPNPNSGLRAITADRQGTIWVAEFLGNRIARVRPGEHDEGDEAEPERD